MSKINLTLINKVAHTFNSDDYMKLRIEHRIKGNLIGCLSSHPRNSNFAGLPAVYSVYELQLLLEKDIVELLDKSDLNQTPSNDQKGEYDTDIKKINTEQNDFLKENKVETTRTHMNKIIDGKRKKLRKQGANEDDIKNLVTEEKILEEARSKIPDLEETNALVQIPMQHSITLTNVRVISKNELEWDNSLKYRVFCDLWNQGNTYITEGDTFGCDFLVYPGDPVYYHASHIVHVVNDTKISPKWLIGQVRLSVNVNKVCLYAYEDEELKCIIYQKLKWKNRLT